MEIVITGATGFIGRPLCAELVGAGHHVTALTRNPDHARGLLGPTVVPIAWGTPEAEAWKQAVAQADVIIHLAGESVAGKRWTSEFKEQIRNSRVGPTRTLVEAIRQARRKPGALICASAIGYYGDCGEATVTEETPLGRGFLADVCAQWEAEALRAREAGVRVALMRTGIVLGAGGALEKMLQPLPLPFNPWKLGLGGPMGSGRQWMPWIHIDDVVGLYHRVATEPRAEGPCNVTAPNPVTNAEFAQAIGRVFHRSATLPVPAFVLCAALGEFAESLLTGQKALPVLALRLGYHFRFPDLDVALKSLLKP